MSDGKTKKTMSLEDAKGYYNATKQAIGGWTVEELYTPTLKDTLEYQRQKIKQIEQTKKLKELTISKPTKPIVPKKPTEAEKRRKGIERVVTGTAGRLDSALYVPGYLEKITKKPLTAEAKLTDNYNEIQKRYVAVVKQLEFAQKSKDKELIKQLTERVESYKSELFSLGNEIQKARKKPNRIPWLPEGMDLDEYYLQKYGKSPKELKESANWWNKEK